MKRFGLFLITVVMCLGCQGIKTKVHELTAPEEAPSGSNKQNSADNNEAGGTSTVKSEPAKQTKPVQTAAPAAGKPEKKAASNTQKENPRFIPAKNLSEAKIAELWSIATDVCFENGYTVANNDKATKNLVCQMLSEGSSFTMRVKFATDGIHLDIKSNSGSLANAFVGDKVFINAKEFRMMRARLAAAL